MKEVGGLIAQVVRGAGGIYIRHRQFVILRDTLKDADPLISDLMPEVRDIAPMKESVEKTKIDLNKIRTQLITLEEKVLFPMLCPSCKHPIRTDFKLCPYCGTPMELPEVTISNTPNIRIS